MSPEDKATRLRFRKGFPMQSPGPRWIPWSVAEEIYQRYSCLFGTDQSLERLAERGGLGWAEVEQIYDEHWQRRRSKCHQGVVS